MKKIFGILLAAAMIFTLSLPVFATDGDVDVNGTIQKSGPTIGPPPRSYDVTYSTTVYWWVTENTFDGTNYKVYNGNVSGPDQTVSNTIKNNTTDPINITFKAFTLTNAAATTLGSSGDLELYLTGNLANDGIGSKDLANGYSTPTPYTAQLVNGTDWNFGFNGTYTGTPTATAIKPTYKITLGFAF